MIKANPCPLCRNDPLYNLDNDKLLDMFYNKIDSMRGKYGK